MLTIGNQKVEVLIVRYIEAGMAEPYSAEQLHKIANPREVRSLQLSGDSKEASFIPRQ